MIGRRTLQLSLSQNIPFLGREGRLCARKVQLSALRALHISTARLDKRPTDWGYNGSACDPPEWEKNFKCGCGLSQSPIDIDLSSIQFSKNLKKIKISYSDEPSYAVNDGHNISVYYESGSTLTGANLESPYNLVQFHFHWGSEDSLGSEHAVNGEKADAELHLVHLNTKYSDVTEALANKDGLAVLGIFLKQSDEKAPASVKPILERFPELKNFNHRYNCVPFDVSKMVPDLSKFVTYDGSLTTPPLTQCVKWIVVQTPLYVTREEMELFRQLPDHFGDNFIDNIRPLQPLNGRTVLANFPKQN